MSARADDFLARQGLPDDVPELCACEDPGCPFPAPGTPVATDDPLENANLTPQGKAALVERSRLHHATEDAHTVGLRLAGRREAYDEIVAMLDEQITSTYSTAVGRTAAEYRRGLLLAIGIVREARP